MQPPLEDGAPNKRRKVDRRRPLLHALPDELVHMPEEQSELPLQKLPSGEETELWVNML